MNWNTSIRVKDENDREHFLEAATSLQQQEGGKVVDIAITELDKNGATIKQWDMKYDIDKQTIVSPAATEFNKNITRQMQVIVDAGAEQW